MRFVVLAALIFCRCFTVLEAQAAVSCALAHADQDIRRMIPESTSYRVRELIPRRHGTKDLRERLEQEMGSPLDPELESADQPYRFYAVYRGETRVALILGNAARAVSGPMEIFVAYHPNGKVREVYVQKMSSPDAPAFRSKYYRAQFRAFGIDHVADEAYAKPPIRLPPNDVIQDHHSFVRAVRLNNLLVKLLYNAFRE